MKARNARLWILNLSLLSMACAVGLILYGFQENITFFYTPADLSMKTISPQQRIRLGGMVEQGSVQRDGVNLTFIVTDFKHTMRVNFQGIAPDLFREGQGVVAEGYVMAPGIFKATTLLAKHDENYMPPELAPLKEAQP